MFGLMVLGYIKEEKTKVAKPLEKIARYIKL